MKRQSGTSRRAFLGAAASGALGAGAVVLGRPPRAHATTRTECTSLVPGLARAPAGGRIDLHAHHVPDFYREALLAGGQGPNPGGYPTPVWTPQRAIEFMDSYGIQMQLLSISDPGTTFLAAAEAKALARRINEYTAATIKDDPTRFGGYAVLPLPDIQGALDELAYALDTLKLDGVGLFTSYAGDNVATPSFEPVWAELNRRKVFVFMHPIALGANDKPSSPLPDFLVEFPFETTRFCATALNAGLTTRHPDLRIQLAHAGGAFPFLEYRIAVLERGMPSQILKDPDSVNGVLPVSQQRGFYYDTALNPAPSAMRSVLEISDVNHIVFGTDWPYTEALFVVPGDPQPLLSETFDTDQRHAVERANALAQLPTAAARLGLAAADTRVDASIPRVRVVETTTGRRELRLLLDARETVQVQATVEHGHRTIAQLCMAATARGRRSLRAVLPDDTPHERLRLVMRITDQFGNRKTVRRTVHA